MTDLIAAIPDLFIVIGALAFTLKCFSYSMSMRKESYFARNFAIVGTASLLFTFAELGHLANDAGVYPVGELVHDILEAAFVVILTVGIVRFFPKWMPKQFR